MVTFKRSHGDGTLTLEVGRGRCASCALEAPVLGVDIQVPQPDGVDGMRTATAELCGVCIARCFAELEPVVQEELEIDGSAGALGALGKLGAALASTGSLTLFLERMSGTRGGECSVQIRAKGVTIARANGIAPAECIQLAASGLFGG